MGCAQSRIENEEAVSRCKERKVFMKEAVTARNGFAAAHSSYTMALKNAGAALSDFGQGESHDPLRPTADPSPADAAEIPPPPPMDTLPPPPPLPDFSPSPLQRSASMPDLPKKFTARIPNTAATAIQEEDANDSVEAETEADLSADPSTPPPPPPPPPRSTPITESKGMDTWDYFFSMDENMAAEIRPEGLEISPEIPGTPTAEMETPMQTPEKLVVETPVPPSKLAKKLKQQGGTVLTAHHQHAASAAGALETKRGKVAASSTPQSLSLLQVLTELDDHFLKASESSHEVSKMLEANRMHYHSNFADNRGHIDHSARVMRVITWNRSFKGIPNANDGKDDFDNDEWETHATVLDKMLAWEKKLYEEVKTGELMKMEYQRKVMLLNKQKKRGSNPEAIEKTKAAVSHLHTRYIVDMQSMDSTVSEIQHLRDHQLYPKLMELVDGMGNMWETMHTHHNSQLKIVSDLRALDISNAPKETSEHHYGRTVQLCDIVREWQAQFQKFMNYQKEYIKSLNSWLKLNLIPIESNLKEKVSSPPRPHHPPIQALLHAWHDYLEKLPDDLAKSAITSFSAVINTIMMLQQEELKQKEKWEETRKEYMRKSRAFEDWCHKYSQSRKGEGGDADGAEGGNLKDPVAEKRFIVEALKTRLDDDEEAHKKLCKQVREKSLGSLRTHLPELFRAMSDFSRANSEMYRTLKSMSQPQNQNQNHNQGD